MATTRGGKRPGSGRKAGIPNKATTECKAAARKYGPAAIRELAKLAGLMPGGKGKAVSEQAQIAACREILDRGYGKPSQPFTGEGGEGPIQIRELLGSIDGRTRGIPNSISALRVVHAGR
jgi:hypothetical protein